MTSDLTGVETREKLVVCDLRGETIGIAEVRSADKRKVFTDFFGKFSLKHGARVGGSSPARAFRVNSEELAAAKARLDKLRAEEQRKMEEEEKAEEERKRAAFDALPENVRLSYRVEGFFNVNSISTVQRMPIELLRGIVEWAEANKLECE